MPPGTAGTAPEDGTIMDCEHAISNSIHFDPDSHYVAYVRARCRFARFEYGLAAGVYMVRVATARGMATKQLIVQ